MNLDVIPSSRRDKSHTSSLFFAICSFSIAILVGFFGLLPSLNRAVGYFVQFTFIVGCLLLVIVLFKHFLQDSDHPHSVWLHPPLLIALWSVFLVFLPGYWTILNTTKIKEAWLSYLLYTNPELFISGPFLLLVGITSMLFVYTIFVKRLPKIEMLVYLGKREILPVTVITLYLLSLIAQIFKIGTVGIAFGADASRLGAFSGFAQWITYLENLQYLVLAILSFHLNEKPSFRKIFVVVIITQIFFAFLSGFIKPIVLMSVVVNVALYLKNGGLNRNLILAFIFLLIVGVLVVPISEQIRRDFRVIDTTDIFVMSDVVQNAFVESWIVDSDRGFEVVENKVLNRFTALPFIPGQVMYKTPEQVPFLGLEKFALLPAYFVPRVLWSNKPVLTQSRWYSIVFFDRPTDTILSSAITYFGEGYLIYGWIGVFITATIWGIALAFIYRLAIDSNFYPLLIALIPFFIDIEGEFTSKFIGLVQVLVVYTFAYWAVTGFFNYKQEKSSLRHLSR